MKKKLGLFLGCILFIILSVGSIPSGNKDNVEINSDKKSENVENSENKTEEKKEYEDYEVNIGDIVLCYDRAVEQAKEYGHSLKREICYLVTHSIFHLLGYDHMEEEEKQMMRTREEQVLSHFHILREE